MKIPAIKYRVIDEDGHTCCVIAVKKSQGRDFSPKVIAETFANGFEHVRHKGATVQLWEDDEFDFSAGEEVRLVDIPK